MTELQEFVDSGGSRDLAYAVVSALAIIWGVRELRTRRWREQEWWPVYWFVTAALLITLGVARAGSIGDWIAEYGREHARSEGWYDQRRHYQAIAVVTVTAVWLITVFVSVWRIPPRRRRYLSNVVMLSTVVAFGGVRIISLHQIDAVLYRRGIGDVRFVSIFEHTLLLLTAVTIVRARLSVPADDERGRTDTTDTTEGTGARRPDALAGPSGDPAAVPRDVPTRGGDLR